MKIYEEYFDKYEKLKCAFYNKINTPQQLQNAIMISTQFVKSPRRLAFIKSFRDLTIILEKLNVLNITNIECLYLIIEGHQNEIELKIILNVYKDRLHASNCYGQQWNKDNLFGE